jgi:hypothetical protein
MLPSRDHDWLQALSRFKSMDNRKQLNRLWARAKDDQDFLGALLCQNVLFQRFGIGAISGPYRSAW